MRPHPMENIVEVTISSSNPDVKDNKLIRNDSLFHTQCNDSSNKEKNPEISSEAQWAPNYPPKVNTVYRQCPINM